LGHPVRNFLCLAVVLIFPISVALTQSRQTLQSAKDPTAWPTTDPAINRPPDANRLLEDSMKLHEDGKRVEAENLLREKELKAETLKLATLARELKIESDQSSLNSTSNPTDSFRKSEMLDGMRKAEAIEKLAHGVRERMESPAVN
jgi:hypothetical protein